MTTRHEPSRWNLIRSAAPIVGLFLGFLLIGTIPIGGGWDRERVLYAILLESALLAIFAPLAMNWRVFAALLTTGLVVTIGLAIICAPDRIGASIQAHLLLAAFAGFLRFLSLSLRKRIGSVAALLVSSLLGWALLVSPLGIDPLLDAAGDGRLRSHVLRAALILNPPASISQSLFDVDWIREGSLYTRTRFASSHPFVYPNWTASLLAFALLSALAAAAGWTGRSAPPREVEGREQKPSGRST
ncbi:MAG: hypothetical protein O7H41_07180 [Planctomycetota bacterium]|nr:hypothetical protein [Planctomycetota bacterium]